MKDIEKDGISVTARFPEGTVIHLTDDEKHIEEIEIPSKRIDELEERISELQAKLDQCMESYADAKDSRDELQAKLDAYDETHMVLPLDADGVPIRFGDVLDQFGTPMTVFAMSDPQDDGDCMLALITDNISDDETWVRARKMRHYKPRTIEDVLREFVLHVITFKGSRDGVPIVGIDDSLWRDYYSEYADELRELMEVDA